jgi:hypothetical protein
MKRAVSPKEGDIELANGGVVPVIPITTTEFTALVMSHQNSEECFENPHFESENGDRRTGITRKDCAQRRLQNAMAKNLNPTTLSRVRRPYAAG